MTAREPAGGGYQALARYVTHETPEQIMVRPALADRPVVSRPYTPFAVPPGEMAVIYVSTPLWFGLLAGEPAQPLHEIPIQRPSDTWFGPSTTVGEVCYASRTLGRLDLQNVPLYTHRALTQVQINNRASTPLLVERLNLPVPYLSLFVAEDRVLWTEAVTMVQERETSLAEFSIENKPPKVAQGITFVAPARKPAAKGMLIRAFGALKITDL